MFSFALIAATAIDDTDMVKSQTNADPRDPWRKAHFKAVRLSSGIGRFDVGQRL